MKHLKQIMIQSLLCSFFFMMASVSWGLNDKGLFWIFVSMGSASMIIGIFNTWQLAQKGL